jgi:alpha-1,2-mannosyltransferase
LVTTQRSGAASLKPEIDIKVPDKGIPQGLLWPLGALFILAFAWADFNTSENGIIRQQVYWGRDFINVWTGGKLVLLGRLDILYNVEAYQAFQRTLFGDVHSHNYSYPPVSYPLAVLFSLLPYWLALTSWLAGTGALFVLACRRWWPRTAGPVWLAVLTPAALVNIWAGHYGFLIGALFLFGWQRLESSPRQAGIAFGLMLIKPHLAVLVPLALIVRREWTALAAGAATVAFLVAATTLCFGWQPWSDFLFRTSGVQASMIDAGRMFYRVMATSFATALMQVGAGWTIALAVQALAALGAALMVGVAAYRQMPTRELAFLVATCTFVVLPYAFNYDMTVVAVGALVLLNKPGISGGDRRLAVYGFLAAQLGMVTACFDVPIMPVLIAGLAGAQFRSWWRERSRAIATGDAAGREPFPVAA